MPILRQQDIWLAWPCLERIIKESLPVEIGLPLAKIAAVLKAPYYAIENQRQELVRRYGKISKQTGLYIVEPQSEGAGEFMLAFGDLLMENWPEEINFEKAVIPASIERACPECGRLTQTVLCIEAELLVPLAGRFIEVEPAVIKTG
jgi:hypothetical protein